MKIKKAELEKVVGVTTKGLPDTGRPEFAFAGRSNVGKSSLINALVQRKSLARTSGSPGKTQTMNFYNVNDELTLVDLPGYGYAKVDESFRIKWGKMIEKYLNGSKRLRGIFVLVDIRHKPTLDDIQMFEWCKSQGFPTAVIATKSDKLKRSEMKKAEALVKSTLQLGEEDRMVLFSAENKSGRDEVWDIIEGWMRE